MRLMLSVCIALILLCSCTNDNDTKFYQALDNGLESSYKLINQQSELVLASLENKRWEASTAEKAAIWYDKALAIKKSTDAITEFIEQAKINIRSDKAKAFELYDSLERYKQYVLNSDPLIKKQFYNNISLVDSSITNEEQALQSDIAKSILTSFQNNVAMTENKLLSFCHDQTATTVLICLQDRPIAFQNAKYVKPGDPIEISAGIGKFMRMVNQKITIAGENVLLDESAVATYKIKAPSQIGKHIYPIRIEYKDQDGRLQMISKEVEFVVMK